MFTVSNLEGNKNKKKIIGSRPVQASVQQYSSTVGKMFLVQNIFSKKFSLQKFHFQSASIEPSFIKF